ncbi:unnamed protein product [Peniophora sp. CBMAI 1063]|nr:unnamed protein product [Peniophora sp. CBMAI 1063]
MSSIDKEEFEVSEKAGDLRYIPGSEAEKRLVRKLDLRIIPAIWLLYVASYLDRANIGNAEAGGMQASLHITDSQYSIILLVFFISYIIFEVPANMLMSRIRRPSLYLSGLCVVWGGVAACMSAAKSYQSLAGIRFCLGIVEAGFAPGVAFYLSSWYKRRELATRYSMFYTATAVSGAFSGLLAGVITKYLNPARGLEGWQWLLLIEGVGASFVGLLTWYILPDWPSTTSWLTPEERFIATQRLELDGIGGTMGSTEKPSHGTAFKMVMSDWRTYILIVMFMLATGSQTIQYFVPALVGQLGYTDWMKQYMTIPVYAVAFVFILFFCHLSDRREDRATWITCTAGIATVSFIITVAVNNNKVKYAFLCFAVGGVYAACPLTLLWVSGLVAHPAEKRAVAIAIVNSCGNSASIYGSFLWPSTTAPRYVQGFATTTVFVALLAILSEVNRWLNKRFPPAVLENSSEVNEKEDMISV